MYGSIISAVTQLLTPDLVAKMASASGISDSTMAQKAVGAAVPAILFGLILSRPPRTSSARPGETVRCRW